MGKGELEKRLEGLEEANGQLKERLIDSMQGEIEARRMLEQVRQYASRLEQSVLAPEPEPSAEPE